MHRPISRLLLPAGAALAGSLFLGLPEARAQFHKPGGAPVAAASTTMPGAAQQQPLGVPPVAVNGVSPGVQTLSASHAGYVESRYGTVGFMDEARLEVWGKAIHHTDGSYTESKSDVDPESNSLQQVTKSKEGVTLQRREVNLNDLGQPAEVLVFDARDQLRFRGVLTYDAAGRFREEVLYTPKNVAVRRKIQEYSPDGRRAPLKVVDYAKKGEVPEGMELIIRQGQDNPSGNQSRGGRIGRRESAPEAPPAAPTPAPADATPSPGGGQPEAKRPGLLRRVFGGKE